MAEIKERTRKNGKKSYTVIVNIKGHPKMTKTFHRLTDAKEWESRIESQIRENINFPHRAIQRLTVGELIDRFVEYELPKKKEKIQKDFRKSLDWYKKEIGELYIKNVTSAKLVECRDKLSQKNKEIPMNNGIVKITEQKISPATVNRYMTYMRVVFAYAVNDLDILDINPMSKVKKLTEDKPRTRYLDKKEITKLLELSKQENEQLYLCVLIALLTGARKSEILKLTWENVDLENEMFYFLDTKNGTDRGVPIHNFLVDELIKYKKSIKIHSLKKDFIFRTEEGKPKETLIGKLFPKVIKKCGIENFRFHDLRHTEASYQAMAGISQPITQKTLGHKSPAMTNRYSHLRDDTLRPTIEKVGNIMLENWTRE